LQAKHQLPPALDGAEHAALKALRLRDQDPAR
jgi:hypothetical protein